jgi:hypothetical protein
MTNSNTGRAAVACNALVYLAIGFGALAFWADAVERGGPIDYLVATMLTIGFGSASFALSTVVMRFAEAKDAGAWFTAMMAVAMGGVLVLIEGGMTHHGLAWLDARHSLATPETLLLASFGLSLFNVFGLYVFVRPIAAKKAATAPASQSADAAVFGAPVAVPATASEAARALAEKRWNPAA